VVVGEEEEEEEEEEEDEEEEAVATRQRGRCGRGAWASAGSWVTDQA
jgi:hypothetical protein